MGRPIYAEDDGETAREEAQRGEDGPAAESPLSEEDDEVDQIDESGGSRIRSGMRSATAFTLGSRVEMYRRSLDLGLAMGAAVVSESGEELGEEYWKSECRREWGVLRPSDSCSWAQTWEKILNDQILYYKGQPDYVGPCGGGFAQEDEKLV